MLPGIYISSPGLEAGGALDSSSAMVEQGVGGGVSSLPTLTFWILYYGGIFLPSLVR